MLNQIVDEEKKPDSEDRQPVFQREQVERAEAVAAERQSTSSVQLELSGSIKCSFQMHVSMDFRS